jgi:hypothetical protein
VLTWKGSVTTVVLTDKKLLVKYISSFVIGDGCLALAGKRGNNARYHLTQRADHEDYVQWQASIIENLCPVHIQRKPAHTDSAGWNHGEALTLSSRSLPFFTTLRDRWYMDGHKVVSPHDIKLFDAESLAILYMDDGSLIKGTGRKKDGYGIMLCTQAFSWADVMLLRDFIADRFDVHFNVRNTRYPSGIKYALYCTKVQVPNFIRIVKPYMQPSYLYKTEVPYEQPLGTEGEDTV